MHVRRTLLPLTALVLPFLCARAPAEDFATRAMSATFKLYNKDSTATGFFVLPPHSEGKSQPGFILVTAEHVLRKMSGEQAIVVLRKAGDLGRYERRDHSFRIREKDKALWIKHPKHDIAVMRVELPGDAVVAPLPLEALATEEKFRQLDLHIASSLTVFGYPTRFEANSAGFPVARHASIASFPLLPLVEQPMFLADYTTFAGDSGGPVFVADVNRSASGESSPVIVGIVLSQFRHDETVETLYEERTVHFPLGLSNIVNSHFVRETIDLLLK